MADIQAWWKGFVQLVEHPLDTLSALAEPGPDVSGGPTLSGSLIFPGTGISDSIASGAVRAYGVDPTTGGLIAPQYGPAAMAAGYDPANPLLFVNQVEADAVNFYNRQLAINTAAGDAGGSSSWLLVGIVVVIVVLFIFKAVK